MPAPAAFLNAFQPYLNNARIAAAESRHHDYRRGLFLDFLGSAFGIQAEEIDVEKYLRIDV
ncbi:MAG TPA: hypothetical protein VMT34_13470, partial [Aggregatilineales bacterium]|nr:hypothetical protein [Aggregatilineales bacterium]